MAEEKKKVQPVKKVASTKKEAAVKVVAEVAPKPVATKSVKKAVQGLQVEVFGIDGKVSGTVDLPEAAFGAKVNKLLIAQAVRVFLANQRAGSASTLSRGEVTGSTRKIYRQKGTGRARHGGIRAPIFVHGGIAHGPKPHSFELKMPQKMRRLALYAALTLKAKAGAIKVVDGLDTMKPKTKIMASLLTQINPEAKSILFVLGDKQDNVIRATRNIEGVTYNFARQLYTYEVMNHQVLVIVKQALGVFAEVSESKKGDK